MHKTSKKSQLLSLSPVLLLPMFLPFLIFAFSSFGSTVLFNLSHGDGMADDFSNLMVSLLLDNGSVNADYTVQQIEMGNWALLNISVPEDSNYTINVSTVSPDPLAEHFVNVNSFLNVSEDDAAADETFVDGKGEDFAEVESFLNSTNVTTDVPQVENETLPAAENETPAANSSFVDVDQLVNATELVNASDENITEQQANETENSSDFIDVDNYINATQNQTTEQNQTTVENQTILENQTNESFISVDEFLNATKESVVSEDADFVTLAAGGKKQMKVAKDVYAKLKDNKTVRVIVKYNQKLEQGKFKKFKSEMSNRKLAVLDVDSAGLSQLLASGAEAVYLDTPMNASLIDSIPLIRADLAHSENATGAGIGICILDTGVDNATISNVVSGYDFVNNDGDAADDNGHGTFMASVIRAVAPDATIISVKVLDSSGTGYSSDIISGIDYCKQQAAAYNIKVISMSLGGGQFTGYCDGEPVAVAVNDAVAGGLFTAVSTGNDGAGYISAPACAQNATAVSATTKSDTLASFSNINGMVDLLAPGESITAIGRAGLETSSGTSVAAAHVSGAAALLFGNEALAPLDAENRFKTTGKLIEFNNANYSRIDVYNALLNNATGQPTNQTTNETNQTYNGTYAAQAGPPPATGFASPTPANATNTANKSVVINVSVNGSDVGTFIWNWNGTNYTMYDDSLVLMFNLDKLDNLIAASYRVNTSGNSYLYEDLTSVTDYTIQSGDYLEYDVYWATATDTIAFDYTNTSGTGDLRDSGAVDQNGVGVHPATDLSAYALNKWYHRKIAIPVGQVGWVIGYYDIACEYDTASNKTGYLANIMITNGAGTVRKVIYDGTSTFTHATHLQNQAALNSMNAGTAAMSKYGNHGLLVNWPTWSSSGKYNGAFNFNGKNQSINISDADSLTPRNMTIALWFKWDGLRYGAAAVEDWAALVSKGIFSNGEYTILMNRANTSTDNAFNLYINSSVRTSFTITGGIDTNWHYLTAVFNGTDAILYLDGVQKSSGAYTGGIPNTANNLGVGAQSDNGYNWGGLLDEVRIWNRSMTQAEITQQYYSNFYKYNNNGNWTFYTNESNLTAGTYTYQGFAKNSTGGTSQTEVRYLNVYSNVSSCAVISTAGNYMLTNNLVGAPISASPLTNYTCVKINASNVLLDCDGYSIIDNGTAGTTFGMLPIGATNVTIRNCRVSNYTYGIIGYMLNSTVITNNTVYNNSINGHGIGLWDGVNNLIENNTVYGNGNGILLFIDANYSTVRNNMVYSNYNGIVPYQSVGYNNFTNNTVANNTNTGFYIYSCSNNRFENNSAYNSPLVFLLVTSASSNTFVNNRAYNGTVGFNITDGSNNNVISNSTVYNNTGYGFYIVNSNGNTVANSTIFRNNYGIDVESSNSSSVLGNNVSFSTNENLLINNGFYGTVSNNYLFSGTSRGIRLQSSSYNNITNNNLTGNTPGIQVYLGSTFNLFVGNNVSGNTNYGFRIFNQSNDNLFINNTACSNTVSGFYEHLDSHRNNFTGNTACNNAQYGFYLLSTDNNTFTGNLVYNNTLSGVYLNQSNRNTFSSNNISNNNATTGTIGLGYYYCNYTTIYNNTVSYSGGDGISSSYSNYVNITSNTANYNGDDNIFNGWSVGPNTVASNSVSNSAHDGIEVYNNTYAQVLNNNISNAGWMGIRCDYAESMVINNTRINVAGQSGIAGTYVNNSNITYNNVANITGGHGIYAAQGFNDRFTNNIIFNTSGHGIYLDTCSNSTVQSNSVSNTSWNGISAYSSNYLVVVYNNVSNVGNDNIGIHASNYTNISYNRMPNSNSSGVFSNVSTGTYIVGNVIGTSVYDGIGAPHNTNSFILDNNITSVHDIGIRCDVCLNVLINNTRVTGATVGIGSSSIINSTINYNNLSGATDGIYFINSSTGNSLSYNTLYNNTYDTYFSNNLATPTTVYMLNTTFTNPSGTLANYTVLTLNDSIEASTTYIISWNSQPASMPTNRISFANKYVNISNLSGSVSIDRLTWFWSDTELTGYNENKFELWKYNASGWIMLNGSPDTSANTLSIANLNPASTFALLQSGLTACSVLNVSGSYTMYRNLTGAPNNASEIVSGAFACVKIAASNVVLDCNGYNITNNGTASAYGVLLNGPLKNVTVKNCFVSSYDYGIYVYQSNNSLFTNDTAFNNSVGFRLESSSNNNTLTNNTVYNSGTYGFMLYSNCSYNTLTNDTSYGNGNRGFYLYVGASYNNLSNDLSYNNGNRGFYLDTNCANNTLANNIAYGNLNRGFHIYSNSNNNTLTNNTAYNNSFDGFRIEGSFNNTLTNNTAYNNSQDGFRIDNNAGYNILNNNTVYNNPYGIYLSAASNNNLTNNNITNNTLSGFFMDINSTSNSLSRNYVCFNDQNDLNNSNSSNTGSNDRCDYVTSWTENGFAGCTMTCSETWHRFFGNVSGNLLLAPNNSQIFYSWLWNGQAGKIYVTNGNATIHWTNLTALGRNTSGGVASNDFAELNSLLNMSSKYDNLTSLYAPNGTNPLQTTNMTLYQRSVAYVPQTNSSLQLNATTGIVWDSGQGGNEFNQTLNQDVVFVAQINNGTAAYQYDIRVPATFDTYKGTSGVVNFWVELD